MAQSKNTKTKMTGKISAMMVFAPKKATKSLVKKQAKNLKKKPVVGVTIRQVVKPRLGGY